MAEHVNTVDMIGRELALSDHPKRIISLVPSQTEFLIDIGAPVVGRTKFCVHPASPVSQIPIVGGTKNYRFDKIRELEPDLIIGNKEENDQEGIVELEKEYPVWMSDIGTLNDAYHMMLQLGEIVDRARIAEKLVSDCREVMNRIEGQKSGKVIYLIWKSPWMAAGKDTFISHLLSHQGYENIINADRYPEVTEEEIRELDPDYIFFSSEPFPFKKEALAFAKSHWPNAAARLVDGELYSWYGSRLLEWGKS